MKIKVAVLQYEVPEGADESVAKLDEMVRQASWSGAKLVVAPETAVGMLADTKISNKDYLPTIGDIAKKNGVYVATSFYNLEKDKVYNQGYIVSDEGKVVIEHKKIYLAPPERDVDGISPGNDVEVADSKFGRLSLLLCKDGFNKFSNELYSKLGEDMVDIICVPTWSLTFKELDTQEYIRALYTYGAFQSRAYLLVSGNLNKSTGSFGRSLIISPVRGVIREASKDRKEMLFEELDLDEVAKAREFDKKWQPKKK